MIPTTRSGAAVALAALLLAVAAAAAVAQRGRAATEPLSVAPGTTLAPEEAAAGGVRARLGVLRRPETPADPAAAADVDAGYVRATGMNLGLPRRLRAETRTFAVPGNGVTCVVTEGGASCTPNTAVGEDYLVGASCDAVKVSGLVADGAASAVIRRADGSAVSAAVTANYLDVTLPIAGAGDVPTAVELGGTSVPLAVVPPDAVECAAG